MRWELHGMTATGYQSSVPTMSWITLPNAQIHFTTAHVIMRSLRCSVSILTICSKSWQLEYFGTKQCACRSHKGNPKKHFFGHASWQANIRWHVVPKTHRPKMAALLWLFPRVPQISTAHVIKRSLRCSLVNACIISNWPKCQRPLWLSQNLKIVQSSSYPHSKAVDEKTDRQYSQYSTTKI